mmetsp:Transcript_19395/g.29778  ORF Transcript_19395/g.29778 Transcript_19395/m.29778 type:complete len:97 (+) Transcript_19395:3546-3836(+)
MESNYTKNIMEVPKYSKKSDHSISMVSESLSDHSSKLTMNSPHSLQIPAGSPQWPQHKTKPKKAKPQKNLSEFQKMQAKPKKKRGDSQKKMLDDSA